MKFRALALLAILVVPLAVETQAGKTPKIAYLSTTAGGEPIDSRLMQLATAAAALVRMDVDVIAVWSPPGVAAVSKATNKIPIVGLSMADPITAGWVKSYHYSNQPLQGRLAQGARS